MGNTAPVAILVLFVFVVVQWIAAIRLRSNCRKAALTIYRELSAMFAGEHTFRVVQEEEISQPAAAGQESPGEATEGTGPREILRAAGFRPLGWLEDVTATAVYPHLRAFLECHASGDGRICATILRVAGLRMFELGTHLPEDRFLVTSNAEIHRLQAPPTTEREILPHGTPLPALISRHRARLAEQQLDPERVIPCRHIEDVLAGSRLYSRQASAHRRSIGYLTEDELMRMGADVQPKAVTRVVWKEFLRLRERDQRAA